MQTYNCMIIEDEPLAAEVLQDYIRQVPFLKLVCCCTDAFYAMEILQEFDIYLMFLDIHLPKMKGLDLIKVLKKPPKIIITSAYQEYALQGYEFNVENTKEQNAKKLNDENIGLTNVRRQLVLLYKEHEVSIECEDTMFKVFLKINLRQYANL